MVIEAGLLRWALLELGIGRSKRSSITNSCAQNPYILLLPVCPNSGQFLSPSRPYFTPKPPWRRSAISPRKTLRTTKRTSPINTQLPSIRWNARIRQQSGLTLTLRWSQTSSSCGYHLRSVGIAQDAGKLTSCSRTNFIGQHGIYVCGNVIVLYLRGKE